MLRPVGWRSPEALHRPGVGHAGNAARASLRTGSSNGHGTMVDINRNDELKLRAGSHDPQIDSTSTLLPMLIGGLILIVVGMLAVMMFT
jgi:hypothetical protein